MSQFSIPVEDILKWNDTSANQWIKLLTERPAILQLGCDIRSSGTVGHMLQHIFAVELRYAQRLASLPESPYEEVSFDSAEQMLATHKQALQMVQELIADPAYDWSVEIDFHTITAGHLRATRQTVLLHLLMHSIRHYAQLATLVRQHGYKPGWPMDYLFMAAKPA